jgi:hypothetical protein
VNVMTIVGSQATGGANAEYDLPEHNNNPIGWSTSAPTWWATTRFATLPATTSLSTLLFSLSVAG